MIAVIFEVVPYTGERHRYLDLAGELRARLEATDGFVSVERFESLTTRGKLLSLSFWRDEDVVRRWRETEEHRHAQRAGREGVFANYRLRVAHVLRDYGLHDRDEAPEDSRAILG
ncbi:MULTISPECIES: antibiotic biosynthesis monooxygenase family protein [Alphaproteobacteria]|uniref:Antibiotic biosynthesis monooxygenase n=2 Tax=Alphaproteobacteria TaxID=28211 RepID=A0A512HFG4_9HYPH|nr:MULTISPECIES: antibiotic biosynthesis monooxygenase [Alphaproteobacteria]GEO84194.1 antibiotic biosynthesis monooxygenase [Ciceribacter naphthalenivorans]GLR24730.1 antibiotic biosynthesis monooxygenase [Ciceribacter naphthalenivorans]GLT07586.1 antibiotic biosynthesis monooxygenase [Sphingomonas psychrolutea]